jgi:hypothetical protein
MNRILSLFLFSLALLLARSTAVAQTPVTSLERLTIDFWPQYDQPGVLVLLTGALPAGTPLPAVVTIPLPAGASLHVVARITDDGGMSDDVVYTQDDDQLTITLPDSRFRVEFYMPDTTDGLEHSFAYTWLSDLAVDAILVQVQQPVVATDMVTEPTAVTVTTSQVDGFVYHVLPAQVVPAGQPYTVSYRYLASSGQLSSENLPATPLPGAAETAVTPSTPLALTNAIRSGKFAFIALGGPVQGAFGQSGAM